MLVRIVTQINNILTQTVSSLRTHCTYAEGSKEEGESEEEESEDESEEEESEDDD